MIRDKTIYDQKVREHRLSVLPDPNDPVCAMCGIRYTTWEEADDCHAPELEKEMEINIQIAQEEGRIDGDHPCPICGTSYYAPSTAAECCTPKGLEDDHPSKVEIFSALERSPYFWVLDPEELRRVILNALDGGLEKEFFLYKSLLQMLASKPLEKIKAIYAIRLYYSDKSVAGLVEHRGLLREGGFHAQEFEQPRFRRARWLQRKAIHIQETGWLNWDRSFGQLRS